eukprot:XP_027326875.1 uncharacterized protein LOC113845476 [Anas platyrhynchos]
MAPQVPTAEGCWWQADKGHAAQPIAFLPGATPQGTEQPQSFTQAKARPGTGPGWCLLPPASARWCRRGRPALSPRSPVSSRREPPLPGQLAGAAFPPGDMPREEFALHSLTPALIIGIEPASLFHKSPELISRSPFHPRLRDSPAPSVYKQREGGALPKGRGTEGCGLPPPRLTHETSALLRHRGREEQLGRAGWQEVPPGRDRRCLTPSSSKAPGTRTLCPRPPVGPAGFSDSRRLLKLSQILPPEAKRAQPRRRCRSAAPCARCQGLPGLLIQSPAHKEGRTEAAASLRSQTLSRDPFSDTLQVLSLPCAPAHQGTRARRQLGLHRHPSQPSFLGSRSTLLWVW